MSDKQLIDSPRAHMTSIWGSCIVPVQGCLPIGSLQFAIHYDIYNNICYREQIYQLYTLFAINKAIFKSNISVFR